MPATPARPIRVMLVDDHPVLRLGLASVLATGHGFSIVAEAEDGPTALDRCRSLRSDVVLLDVSMERMDGIDTLRRLLGEFPAARVIMLTSSKAPQDEALALDAGAMGYLVKTVHHAAIARAAARSASTSPSSATGGSHAPGQPRPIGRSANGGRGDRTEQFPRQDVRTCRTTDRGRSASGRSTGGSRVGRGTGMDSLRRSTGLLPALRPGSGVADWGRGMVMTALASLAASAAVFLAA